jgi:hypothetical protein
LSKLPLPSGPEAPCTQPDTEQERFSPADPVHHILRKSNPILTPMPVAARYQLSKIDYDVSRPDFNGLHVEIQACSQEEWG